MVTRCGRAPRSLVTDMRYCYVTVTLSFMGSLSLIVVHSGAAAESGATPTGRNWYSSPVFGLISNQFEIFHTRSTLLATDQWEIVVKRELR